MKKQKATPARTTLELIEDAKGHVSTLQGDLLAALLTNKIDLNDLLLEEMKSRGLDPIDGEWIGWASDRARKLRKKYKQELKPMGLIKGDLQANRDTLPFSVVFDIGEVLRLMKAGKEEEAFEKALRSTNDVQYYTLQPIAQTGTK